MKTLRPIVLLASLALSTTSPTARAALPDPEWAVPPAASVSVREAKPAAAPPRSARAARKHPACRGGRRVRASKRPDLEQDRESWRPVADPEGSSR